MIRKYVGPQLPFFGVTSNPSNTPIDNEQSKSCGSIEENDPKGTSSPNYAGITMLAVLIAVAPIMGNAVIEILSPLRDVLFFHPNIILGVTISYFLFLPPRISLIHQKDNLVRTWANLHAGDYVATTTRCGTPLPRLAAGVICPVRLSRRRAVTPGGRLLGDLLHADRRLRARYGLVIVTGTKTRFARSLPPDSPREPRAGGR